MIDQLSFILPAYNEEGNIAAMIVDAVAALDGVDYEIIVVDDGSDDATANIVDETARTNPKIDLVRHPQNLGYGSAVMSGLTRSSKEFVFFTDSDRQFDLAELAMMFEKIQRADLVAGYRAPRRDPFMRRLNGWGWSFLINRLFGYTGRDIDCAFKLMRRDVVSAVVGKITSGGPTFSAELLIRTRDSGFRVVEVPVRGHRPRVAGSPTGARVDVILRGFSELLKFRIDWLKESRRAAINRETRASTAQVPKAEKLVD